MMQTQLLVIMAYIFRLPKLLMLHPDPLDVQFSLGLGKV